MAKPKQRILIKKFEFKGIVTKAVNLYIDDAAGQLADVLTIEGVTEAYVSSHNVNLMLIDVDPRYDLDEVGAEIESLVTAEVPDVFRE